MVNLSAARINTTSPYTVSDTRHNGEVVFITKFGVRYTVGYELTELLTCAETYQFYITNTNNTKSPRDPMLRTTILAIVADFFAYNKLAMLYVCDTGDDKQSMRSRLFAFWASRFPGHEQYAVASGRVTDEEGNENFATLIIPKNHPNAKEAIDEFYDAINALASKPQH